VQRVVEESFVTALRQVMVVAAVLALLSALRARLLRERRS